MSNAGLSTEGEGFLSRMALNDNKAGMEGLDRDKINKIIMESSKGSRFYENELKKEQQVNQRIEKMMLQKAQITEQQLRKAQAQVERVTSSLEKGRDLSRMIVHVDMDAFYAAVEMKDSPDLKDKPMAVGSMSMLSTSNYIARKFGVRAAMPGFIAKKLCPNLVIVPVNFDKYRVVSTEVREIFADYDPFFLAVSLDEAYLDITEHLEQRKNWPESLRTHRLCKVSAGTETGGGQPDAPQNTKAEIEGLSPVLFEDSPSSSPILLGNSGTAIPNDGDVEVFGICAEEAVREMRFRIEQRTLLTASAGIGPNMMLAKVCSDKNKPNGQYKLPSNRQAVMDFVQDLPVRKVSGIGKVTEKMLGALGITSCSHLGQEMAMLSLLFSETSWHHFLQISLGLGSTHIERDGERKSMSTERTFGEMSVAEEQLALCRELCQDLADDLKKEGLKGKTVTLKLKNVNFEGKTRALTLPCAVATAEEIFAVSKDLLKTEVEHVSPQPLRLRLMGVRISGFGRSDDKKPLQKSIVGFLHQSKADCSVPSQVTTADCPARKEPLLQPSVQSSSSGCPPLVHHQPPQVEKALWSASRRGQDASAGQQQSFFQRAHAQRLQLQADSAVKSEDAGGNSVSSITSIGLASPTKPQDHVSDPSITLSREPRASMSDPDTGAQAESGLPCPVCFTKVKTTDLNVFNRHIDHCLGAVAPDPHQDTDPEGLWERESENDREANQEELVEEEGGLDEGTSEGVNRKSFQSKSELGIRAHSVACRLTDAGTRTNKSERAAEQRLMETNRPLAHGDTLTKQTVPKVSLKPHCSPGMVTPYIPGTCDARGPALTCPVCQVTQNTDDLSLFNRHVDLCLNKEVLSELGGIALEEQAPPPMTGSKVKGM
ncbi:DNA polymerase kappa [Aplochiton taeniatus]